MEEGVPKRFSFQKLGTSREKCLEEKVKDTKKTEERNRKEKKVKKRRNQGGQGEKSRWLGRGSITIISFIKVVGGWRKVGGRETDFVIQS